MSVDSEVVEGLPDDELLALIACGDHAALGELYDRHAGWLLLRLGRRCADQGLVEEVLQDTFVSVWRSARGYSSGSAGGWLWTVASRRMVDALRKAERTDRVTPGYEQTIPGAEEQVVTDLSYGPLGQALDRLSPELRQALQATVLDGLSTRDAALLLGIPQGTVKTRAARARAQLRAGLA